MLNNCFVYLFLCIPFSLFAEVQLFSFQDLEKINPAEWQEQSIRIRGFLYVNHSNAFILAGQPQLRSCCIGSHSKIREQIVVQHLDLIDSTQHAVTLEGVLAADPMYDESGYLMRMFVLKHSRLVDVPSRSFPWLLVVAIISAVGIAMLFKLSKGQRRDAGAGETQRKGKPSTPT